MTEAQAAHEKLDDFLGVKPESPWLRRGKWAGVAILALLILLILYRCFGPANEARYSTEEVLLKYN